MYVLRWARLRGELAPQVIFFNWGWGMGLWSWWLEVVVMILEVVMVFWREEEGGVEGERGRGRGKCIYRWVGKGLSSRVGGWLLKEVAGRGAVLLLLLLCDQQSRQVYPSCPHKYHGYDQRSHLSAFPPSEGTPRGFSFSPCFLEHYQVQYKARSSSSHGQWPEPRCMIHDL